MLSPIFLFSCILRFCGRSSVFSDQKYYQYFLQVFILHVAIIEAESILSVHEPFLKNTDQGWWTFQNGKLLAKGQCILDYFQVESEKWRYFWITVLCQYEHCTRQTGLVILDLYLH